MYQQDKYSELASSASSASSIHKTIDGSIDFRFYQRRAHCLRSEAAWNIISHMSRVLPFFRNEDETQGLEYNRCA